MDLLEDCLAIPDHLGDALWRVDSARLSEAPSAGLLVCGMGGSAIGGDLAAAVLGERLVAPLLTVRGYQLPSWASAEWTVLCCSYSGETEETLACFEAAGRLGARRIVSRHGGTLVERAREAGDPVIGLPGILAPRRGCLYVRRRRRGRCPGRRRAFDQRRDRGRGCVFARADGALRERAAEIAARLAGALPVVCGAGLSAPIARRWKTQINENAKLAAFFTELPEADHNEICGWSGLPEGAAAKIVLLEDAAERNPRLRQRFELTAATIGAERRDGGAGTGAGGDPQRPDALGGDAR